MVTDERTLGHPKNAKFLNPPPPIIHTPCRDVAGLQHKATCADNQLFHSETTEATKQSWKTLPSVSIQYTSYISFLPHNTSHNRPTWDANWVRNPFATPINRLESSDANVPTGTRVRSVITSCDWVGTCAANPTPGKTPTLLHQQPLGRHQTDVYGLKVLTYNCLKRSVFTNHQMFNYSLNRGLVPSWDIKFKLSASVTCKLINH